MKNNGFLAEYQACTQCTTLIFRDGKGKAVTKRIGRHADPHGVACALHDFANAIKKRALISARGSGDAD